MDAATRSGGQQPYWSSSSQLPIFHSLNSRELNGGLQVQMKPGEFSREMIENRRQIEALAREQAFSLPSFAANRICPWCSTFCTEDHFMNCAKRLVTCPLCKEYVLATAAVQHYKDCEEAIVYIATERIARRFEEQRRAEEEEAERRRVQQLHAQAESDAQALRRRASSLVTKKQSLGNLLFSGVSLGNEGTAVGGESEGGQSGEGGNMEGRPQQSILVDGGSSHSMGPKRSMVRILSQPEMAMRSGSIASTNPSQMPQSGGEDTGSGYAGAQDDASSGGYNRQGSFFTRTNSAVSAHHHNDPMAAGGGGGDAPSPFAQTVAPRQQSFNMNSTSQMPTAQGQAADTDRRSSAAGVTQLAPEALATMSSFYSVQSPDNHRPSMASPMRGDANAAPPLPSGTSFSLPRSLSSAAAPPQSFSRKIPPPPTTLPMGSAVAPPHGRDNAESPARPPSASSATPMVANGMKKCKWCSVQAPVEHEKKCVSRIVQCKKCSSMIKLKDKEEHMRICSALRGETTSALFSP